MPLYWHVSDVILMIKLRLWFEEEDNRGNVIFITSYQGYLLSTRLMTVGIDLDRLAEVVLVRFRYCIVTFSFLPVLYSLEGSHCAQLHLKSSYVPSSFRAEHLIYVEFFCTDWSLLLHLLIYSIIYITIDSWTFILHFGLWFQPSLFCGSNCSSFDHLKLLCPFDWHSPIKHFLTFWHYNIFLGSSCIFPLPVLKSTISPRNPHSFYWRMIPETKIWALGVLIAAGVSFILGPLSWQSQEICLYINPCMYTYL